LREETGEAFGGCLLRPRASASAEAAADKAFHSAAAAADRARCGWCWSSQTELACESLPSARWTSRCAEKAAWRRAGRKEDRGGSRVSSREVGLEG
jgi:hypothetical protein